MEATEKQQKIETEKNEKEIETEKTTFGFISF